MPICFTNNINLNRGPSSILYIASPSQMKGITVQYANHLNIPTTAPII